MIKLGDDFDILWAEKETIHEMLDKNSISYS